MPDKLQPVFIYEYDLSGNQLHEALQKELMASKYLIVICSPDSARSKYVNDEVQSFIDQGREEYIIPFIVDGQPNSADPATECFPPALLDLLKSGDKSKEIRGISIATNGEHQALVDVVATMLGVRRDLLWNRYRARQMRQRVAMAAVAVAALLCALLYWDYTRPTYRYFADYVDVWGVPTGVVEVDEEQVKHRYGMYRFEYRRVPFGVDNPYSESDRRVVEVAYVNAQGSVINISQTEHIDRYPILIIDYDDDNGGRIKNITCCQEDGKKIVRYKIADHEGVAATNVDIENISPGGGIAHASSNTTVKAESDEIIAKAKISRYHYYRDENTGVVIGVSYHRSNDRLDDSLISDADGVSQEFYRLDSLGRITHRYYFNKDGNRHVAACGVSARKYEYDQYGNIARTECLDLSDNLINNDLGWAVGISVSNEFGNAYEEYYLDANNRPCMTTDRYHKGVVHYGENNTPSKLLFYDVNGNLCTSKQGYAIADIVSDRLGRVVEMRFFDHKGGACFDSIIGCHIMRIKYQGTGMRIIESRSYGIDGELCLNKEGLSIKKIEYDRRGNPYIEKNYDENGDNTYGNNGVSILYSLYDGDRISGLIHYGVDGKIRNNNDGCVAYYFVYDDRGNVEEIQCVDKNARLVNNNNGYAVLRRCYNDSGQLLFEEYLDENRSLYTNPETKYARLEYLYDERGNLTQLSYLDQDRDRCDNEMGLSVVKCEYDAYKNVIKREYYNKGMEAVEIGGSAAEILVYNNVNQHIESRYYNRLNHLISIEQYTYDELNRCIQITHYNAQRQPYLKGSKAYIEKFIYDGFVLIEHIFCGDHGKMFNGPEGYARRCIVYDERGNEIENTYYDETNTLCKDRYARNIIQYNSRNQIICNAYYNDKNQLIECDEGYAMLVAVYDKFGNQCEMYALDRDKVMIPRHDNGVAKICCSYDDRGNNTMQCFYNKDNLLVDTNGYAKIIYEYNIDNLVTRISRYNAQNELYDKEWATIAYSYDDGGNVILEEYFNNIEELLIKKYLEYNENGDIIEEDYYNRDDLMCVGPDGYARAVAEYSSDGNLTNITFYDQNGNDITEQFTN